MVTFSICTTIYILNIHFRTPELNKNMPRLVRKLFLEYLPKFIYLKDFRDSNDLELLSEMKSKSLLNASISSRRSLEAIYSKNALITREILTPATQDNYDDSNVIILVESDSIATSCENSLRKSSKCSTRSSNKKLSNESLKFQYLVLQNIGYLNEIVNYIKRDHDIKRVIRLYNQIYTIT